MANNNFQILLKGMIDPKSQATIEKQIKTLSASIKEHIRLKVQIDSTQFNTIFQEINKLQQHINILSQNPISNANMSEFSEYVKQAGLNLDSVSKQMRQVAGESPIITKEIKAWSNQIGESVKITTNLNRASKDYGNSVINVNNSLKQQKQLQQQLELFQQKMLGGNGIAGQIDILGEKFKNIDPNVLSQLRNDVQNLNVTTPNLNQQMQLTTVRLNNIKTAAMQSGSVFTRMIENMYKFLRFYIIGGAIVRVINTFRNMISTLTEIDTELTQLRKVTGETLDTMADFAFVANDTGKNLGATTQEVINATTEFARLGYTIKDASKLAEESILFSTVGNMSVERASSALISTVKAFGIEVDEQGENIRSIIDMVNEVGNRFAISQEDIAEILRRSSSAMREAGNTIEEVIALGTSGQEVVQNSQQIGTALRTISMRIRGVSEEGEDLTDLIPSMEKLFNSVGLTLKENETTFKSTYDIIKDLSSVWETLTDMKRANILESVAGKRQGQIVAAMISNFESAEEALKTAQNSAGSAEAEFNRAMDSIEFKSNQLAQTFTGLWQKAVDRETIKSFLDAMISMAEVIDYLVNNPISKILMSSAALVGTLKLASMGIIALGKSTIGTAAGVIALDIAEKGLLKTTVALTEAMWKSPFFKVMVVITAVTAIVKIVQYLNSSLDRQKEKVEELSQSYKDLQLELDSVNTELKDITSRIDELNNKDSLSLVEQDELEKLQITNRELQQKIDLLEREAELTASDSGEEVVKLYKDTYNEPVSRERIDELRGIGGDIPPNVSFMDSEKDINALIAAYENFRDLRDESLSDEEFVFYNDILKEIERSLIDDSKELMNFRDILRDLPDPTEEQLNILDEINNTLKFTRSIISPEQLFSDTWNKLEKEQREYIKSLVENNKFTEQQARDYEELDDLLNVIGFSFDKLSDYIENQIESQTELNDYLDFTVEKTEELDDLYKNLTDTIKYINNLNHDYAKNQSLTAEQVEELIRRYPQLTSYIHKTADGWKIEGKALKELNNIREDSVKIAVLAQAGITEAHYNNLRERLKLYGIEIESITGIADAAKAMMPYMASGASSETVSAVLKYGKALDRIRGLQEALSDPNYGIGISKNTSVYRAQVNILYELEEQLRRVNIALERNQILTNLADESEKNQLYNERIGLLRQQQDALHQINEARRKMIRDINNQLSSAGFQIDYNAQLNELMIKNMKHLSNFTDDAAKEYENLIKQVLDLNEANQDSSTKWLQIEQDIESVIESMISLNEANKDVIATVESKIMDIIRKRYEEQGKIREEEYNKEKEVLNNSLNEYKSYVQGMLDEMDRLYNTEDYEKQIQKQSQAIMDIQSDINKLSLAAGSGDMDAQTKINDLREKLDEEREKLVEIQTKRERDLRKQNLQDSIKDYEENTKKQIEILDKEYEDFQSKLDSKLSEENIYLETRKAMMTGHIHAINDDLETVEYKFEDIETAYINFENRFGEGLSLLGNKIKSEFIDNIQLAKKAILQLQDVTVGSGSIEIEKAKEQIGVLQTLWNTVKDDKKRKEYADEADRLRKKYGLEFEDLRGYTGVYNSNSTTSQIPNPSSTLSNLVKNIPKFILNPLDNVVNKIPQYTTKTSSSNNDIKLSLNFPNIIGEMNKSKAGDIANEVFGRFRLELKKLGVQL